MMQGESGGAPSQSSVTVTTNAKGVVQIGVKVYTDVPTVLIGTTRVPEPEREDPERLPSLAVRLYLETAARLEDQGLQVAGDPEDNLRRRWNDYLRRKLHDSTERARTGAAQAPQRRDPNAPVPHRASGARGYRGQAGAETRRVANG